jgi:hypothetical protein
MKINGKSLPSLSLPMLMLVGALRQGGKRETRKRWRIDLMYEHEAEETLPASGKRRSVTVYRFPERQTTRGVEKTRKVEVWNGETARRKNAWTCKKNEKKRRAMFE